MGQGGVTLRSLGFWGLLGTGADVSDQMSLSEDLWESILLPTFKKAISPQESALLVVRFIGEFWRGKDTS